MGKNFRFLFFFIVLISISIRSFAFGDSSDYDLNGSPVSNGGPSIDTTEPVSQSSVKSYSTNSKPGDAHYIYSNVTEYCEHHGEDDQLGCFAKCKANPDSCRVYNPETDQTGNDTSKIISECEYDNRPENCPDTSKQTRSASSCPNLSAKEQACEQTVISAEGVCDSDRNGELKSANGLAGNISAQLGGITASNIALACGNFAKVSMTANAAFASYQAYCLSEKLTAQNACSEFKASLLDSSDPLCNKSEYKTNLASLEVRIQKLNTHMQQAQSATNQLAQTSISAEQCKCMTAASQTDPSCASKFDPCAKDPSSQLCLMAKMTECNLPQNASTPLCICNKNPNDPSCPGSFKPDVNAMGVVNNGSSGGSSTGGTSGNQALFDNRLKGSAGGGPNLNMDRPGFVAPEGGNQKADSLAVGGGGNNSLLSGSGVNAAGGRKGGAGPAGEKEPIRVNAGFRSGGGGGMGYGGSGGSGGGGYGGYGSAGRGANGEKVDLRQFLPNGKYDPRIRGIAGLRQNPDGITGPHSDIWMKIKARYLYQTPTLNP